MLVMAAVCRVCSEGRCFCVVKLSPVYCTNPRCILHCWAKFACMRKLLPSKKFRVHRHTHRRCSRQRLQRRCQPPPPILARLNTRQPPPRLMPLALSLRHPRRTRPPLTAAAPRLTAPTVAPSREASCTFKRVPLIWSRALQRLHACRCC